MTASTPFDAGAPRDEHPPPAPVSSTATRVRRRRRPSGEPPPLPRQLHASGKGWLLLVGVVVVAGVAIGTVQPVAVTVDVADNAVLSAFVSIRTPWLTQAARAAGVLSTPLGVLAVWWATLAVLLIWRRWRHLLVSAVALFTVTLVISLAVDMVRRPRPLGVEALGDWTEFAMPSLPMGILTGRARELDEQALAMRQRLYDGDHPEVARSLSNLAVNLHELGEHGRARELDEQALAMRQRLDQAKPSSP